MKRITRTVLVISATLLLISGSTGYSLRIDNINSILGITIMATAFSELVYGFRTKTKRVLITVILFVGGAAFIGVTYMVNRILGDDVNELGIWTVDRHEIRQVSRVGIAGPMYYEFQLHQLTFFGLLSKQLDNSRTRELSNCQIEFETADMEFNKCTNELKAL